MTTHQVRPHWIALALAAALITGCTSPEALRQADENNSPFSAANIAAAAVHSVAPTTACAGKHDDSASTTGTSSSTTTGVPGNSTTTGTSSSETNSSGTSFSACVGN